MPIKRSLKLDSSATLHVLTRDSIVLIFVARSRAASGGSKKKAKTAMIGIIKKDVPIIRNFDGGLMSWRPKIRKVHTPRENPSQLPRDQVRNIITGAKDSKNHLSSGDKDGFCPRDRSALSQSDNIAKKLTARTT
jgi:hypothetical protein